MKASLAVATFCLALGGVAVSGTQGFAQRSPYSYHLCALDKSGATDCYYDSARACAVQTLAPCIPNPWYNGSDAMAQAPLQRKHRVVR